MNARHWPLLGILAMPLSAGADAWDLSGSIEFETRWFASDPAWPGQTSGEAVVALSGQAEFRWQNEDRSQRASVIPFVRWDAQDDERSLVDLQEAYWAYRGDDFEILVGSNTVFWGVTESVHLVDVINQTDAAGDIDGEDKLGQPMVNVTLQRDWGALGLYVMPWFRERTFAGADGRLRPPLPVDADAADYSASAGQNHVDVALRYSHYFGDVDLGVSWFRGTGRDPRWVPDAGGSLLRPVYDVIDQVGVDLQYTRDAWLWKFEGLLRNGHTDHFAAAVGGFEYTRFQIAESDADLGLLVEYQYDGRAETEPLSINDNDVFVGARLALNDIQDSSLLGGVAYDTDTGETLISLEGERRLGDRWVVELTARFFSGAARDEPTYALRNDDYLEIRLARFF